MSNSHDDDDDNRKDLTRLEDLSEFLHEEDPELELKFDDFKPSSKNSSAQDDNSHFESESSLPELPDLPDAPEIQEDDTLGLSSEIMQEVAEESEGFGDDSPLDFGENTDASNHSDDNFPHADENIFSSMESIDSPDDESSILADDSFSEEEQISESENAINEDFQALDSPKDLDDLESDEFTPIEENDNIEHQRPTPIEMNPPEKFEDVKNFAQNFSYGTIEGAGNPPYSIIIRNIRFNEDADDILNLLKELAIIDSDNIKDYEQAIHLGSLLIPQISEYTAIIIAHKLRRFDLDIEVGLTDEIHPSKSGETNSRGLTQKGQIKQNREEEFRPSEREFTINEILVTTNNTLEGFSIKEYLGIDHAHTFIDEDELERLHFINKGLRENNSNSEDLEHYQNYKDSFNKLHDELVNEIKMRAFKTGANALLGVQFTMNQMADHKKSQYQLSCSATCAFVEKN